MSGTQLLQALINGALLGGVYGGVAMGLSLILGVLRVVNLAHSAVLILGALVYWELVSGAGFDPLAMILPVALGGFVLGLVVHRGIAQYLARESDSTVMLAALRAFKRGDFDDVHERDDEKPSTRIRAILDAVDR